MVDWDIPNMSLLIISMQCKLNLSLLTHADGEWCQLGYSQPIPLCMQYVMSQD